MTMRLQVGLLGTALVSLAVAPAAGAQAAGRAPTGTTTATAPVPAANPAAPKIAIPSAAGDANANVPMVQPVPLPEPQMHWSLANARALLGVIQGAAAEGLIPEDYQLVEMRAAIADGEGLALDTVASQAFSWLAEDLRDGRTPMTARLQWFAVDPDQDKMPTSTLMKQALDTGDVPGVLASLNPTHPDYKALKSALATTPDAQKARRAQLRANMDRWRWLARDLGDAYLITNVPEFQLRLTVRDKIVRTYRTVVGKPGRTATPQLAETVQAVVFNPTWTVPQSIVVGEGLGASLLRAPRAGYKVTKNGDGTLTVVQQPGDSNSLGRMKIDMPNPHAIYLHDTPSKQYFNQPVRAYSHGCIRTERAVELGMTMAILGADMPQDQLIANANSLKYTRVPMTKTFPVYITYFTTGVDITGKLATFADIYGRDAPVLASFNQPRQLKTTQRMSNEEIIKLDNPL